MHTKGYTLRLSLSELLLISIREEFTLEVESLKVGKAKKAERWKKTGKGGEGDFCFVISLLAKEV